MIENDKKKIRQILSQPDISETFYGGDGYVDLFGGDVMYFLNSGCLFPSVRRGDCISMHAAIPPKLRGRTSIYAAKAVFDWVFNNLDVSRIVSRIDKARRNVSFYAVLCGMRKTHEDSIYTYYEVMNG